ncbi:hypothetical protein [Nocardiopsis synnemataformans]|uniref:hypothetical protein n=1 Tax=Nocardiopsis synnemataformans TaxID=61305 RepID=UPI003EBBAABB
MTELGAVFRPPLPPERLRSVARAADEAGLDQLWLWEDCFLESGAASAALAWTENLTGGVGLLSATGPDADRRMATELRAEGLTPQTGVAADADRIAEAVRHMAEAGADTVVLQPTADEPDPEGFVRFTAERVRPRLP